MWYLQRWRREHILECDEILKNTNKHIKEIEYEEFFKDNMKNQTEIAKMFIENMKIKKQLIERTWKVKNMKIYPLLNQVTGLSMFYTELEIYYYYYYYVSIAGVKVDDHLK